LATVELFKCVVTNTRTYGAHIGVGEGGRYPARPNLLDKALTLLRASRHTVYPDQLCISVCIGRDDTHSSHRDVGVYRDDRL
jgi:hypothetical protein